MARGRALRHHGSMARWLHRFACMAPIALALQLSASSASADPPPSETPSRWYGWQVLAAEAPFQGLAWVGVGTGNARLWLGGLAGSVPGGPIVHFAHGHFGKGFGALGVNIG